MAWMLWVACASVVALLTRNPWYLLLIGWLALGIRWRLTGERPGRGSLALFGGLILFPALLNFAFSRAGDTVLLRLPIHWIGGPYTLEAFLFGVSAGVQLASLLMVMSVFTVAVTAVDLLRRIPSGLYPTGVSASIGLTFVPQARRSFEAIREAQRVRGHEPRTWRDLPGLMTPLVVLSLENALGLAEGMVSRGWSRGGTKGWRRWLFGLGWLGLAVGLGIWAVLPGLIGPALGSMALGGGALWLALRGGDGRSRYRPERWRRPDTLVSGLALGVFVVFLFLAITAPSWLVYYPYPQAAWPSFRLGLAAALGLLAAPLWVRSHDDRDQ